MGERVGKPLLLNCTHRDYITAPQHLCFQAKLLGVLKLIDQFAILRKGLRIVRPTLTALAADQGNLGNIFHILLTLDKRDGCCPQNMTDFHKLF